MEDLNDYRYFTEVVKHGGFSAAGRALQMPKSKLSRRVAGLEQRLRVRLIERSPHRFLVTEVGRAFYDHCQSMLLEAERARSAACEADRDPHGSLRVSGPIALVDRVLAPLLPPFLQRHPRVQLQVLATDRRIDLIEERIHVALRARPEQTVDTVPGIEVRPLSVMRWVVVASPVIAATVSSDDGIESLSALPTVSMVDPVSDWLEGDRWVLDRADGERTTVWHEPRFASLSAGAVLEAVRAGLGVGLVPDIVCEADLRSGSLVRLWPEWFSKRTPLWLEFTSARGRLPAVRALVEHLELGLAVECGRPDPSSSAVSGRGRA